MHHWPCDRNVVLTVLFLACSVVRMSYALGACPRILLDSSALHNARCQLNTTANMLLAVVCLCQSKSVWYIEALKKIDKLIKSRFLRHREHSVIMNW